MNLQHITDTLRNLAHDELKQLADWCNSEARKKDPVYLAEQAQQAKWEAERQAKYAAEAAHLNRVAKALKALLKPGMMLKMKGCKDGLGLREFIRWDENENLVCWQLRREKEYRPNSKSAFWVQERTNQVTTHMPDKVTRVFIDGTGLLIKSILK